MNKIKRIQAVGAKYLPLIVGLFLVIVAGYFFAINDITLATSRDCGDFTAITDYTVTEKQAEDAPLGFVQEYRMTLNEYEGESTPHLIFYARHQYVRVFIGDELVYSLMPSEENHIGKTVGLNWVKVHLKNTDLGKEILVEITPVYASHADRVPEFLLGSELGVYQHQLRTDMPQIVLGVVAILMGLIFVFFGLLRKFQKKPENTLVALGLFSAIIGLWRLTDIRYAAFAFSEHPVLLAYLSIATLMMCIVPLCRYSARNHKHRHLTDGYSIVTSLVCLAQIVLQLSGIKDFRETLTWSHIMIVAGVVCIVIGALINRKYIRRDVPLVERLLPIVFASGVMIDVVIYFVVDSSYNLLFTLLSLNIYIGISGVRTIYNYLHQEKLLAQKEAELTEARVAVTLSQIQPHFLYNSLNTIAELCYEDPMKARTATVDFAEYLRVNLKAIQTKTLVPFTDELAHIRRYTDLEKMRFDERLNVIFDIRATDFVLPQLSVQPLVENAVKHGVCEKEEGGTVTVSTDEQEDCFRIIITDDGVGFDADTVENDGQVHIGLTNSRNRLADLCGGTVEITSGKGKGTTATIRIPKEKI